MKKPVKKKKPSAKLLAHLARLNKSRRKAKPAKAAKKPAPKKAAPKPAKKTPRKRASAPKPPAGGPVVAPPAPAPDAKESTSTADGKVVPFTPAADGAHSFTEGASTGGSAVPTPAPGQLPLGGEELL